MTGVNGRGETAVRPPSPDLVELIELRQRVADQKREIAALVIERRVLANRVDQLENGIEKGRAYLREVVAPAALVSLGDGTCVIRPAEAKPAERPAIDPDLENIMRMMAQFHPVLLSWRQLTTLTRLEATDKRLLAFRRAAQRRGLLILKNEVFGLTHAGFDLIQIDPLTLPTQRHPAELLALWRTNLRHPADRMLVAIVQAAGPITRAELAIASATQDGTGHFRSGVRTLRENLLITEAAGRRLQLVDKYRQALA